MVHLPATKLRVHPNEVFLLVRLGRSRLLAEERRQKAESHQQSQTGRRDTWSALYPLPRPWDTIRGEAPGQVLLAVLFQHSCLRGLLLNQITAPFPLPCCAIFQADPSGAGARCGSCGNICANAAPWTTHRREWRWWEARGESRSSSVAEDGNTALYSTARKRYLLKTCYSSSLLLFYMSVVCRIISGTG